MTKDRRLGRGLAALLGTPLEESPANDASHAASSFATSSLATSGSAEQRSSGGSSSTTAKSNISSAEAAETGNFRSVDGSERSAKAERVTGSVPLNSNEGRIRSLDLSVYEIDNNPFQPRRKFNEEEIAALAESLKEHKQLQPVLVRRVGDRYQLISGERRLRATIHAGLKTIRAEVRQADDRLVAELAIVENLQRKDLDAIEKALSFRRYLQEHKCTQEDLARRLKIDRSTIANLMRLLELPDQIQQWVQADKITAGHAKALLPLGDERQQLDFAKRIENEAWTVRDTERRVAEQLESEDGVIDMTPPKKASRKRVMSPQIVSLEQQLRLSLGTKVEIRQGSRGKGRITVQFSSPAEFDRLIQLMYPARNSAAA